MKRLFKNIALICCVLGLSLAFHGCEQEGPAEKAGEKVDTMMEDAQKSMEEAGEKMGDMIEESGEKLEDAGEKMQE